jgi:acetyltransferase-like isoleucine patch superfamily enzyme
MSDEARSAWRLLRPKYAFRFLLGAWYTYRLTGRPFPVRVEPRSSRCRMQIFVSRRARVSLAGPIILEEWMGNAAPVFLKISKGGELRLSGAFVLGPGVRIAIGENALLSLGGARREPESGVTENARILVRRSVTVGEDFLCSWNLFLTDSDHHPYGADTAAVAPVTIGDHVWVGPNCSILKGAVIGADCVVANGAVVGSGEFPQGTLIGGLPARAIGKALAWKR